MEFSILPVMSCPKNQNQAVCPIFFPKLDEGLNLFEITGNKETNSRKPSTY